MKPAARGNAGQVRIIGGALRGSLLHVAPVPGLRPTPARVRETLFNWLQPVITGANCLDLFAGTGALGLEALSRGAAAVTFVEHDVLLASALQANFQRLRQHGAHMFGGVDALVYLDRVSTAFDVAFLDPPFDGDYWHVAAQRLEQGGWLRDGAMVYVESPAHRCPKMPANWVLHRERCAGRVRYALYRRAQSDQLD